MCYPSGWSDLASGRRAIELNSSRNAKQADTGPAQGFAVAGVLCLLLKLIYLLLELVNLLLLPVNLLLKIIGIVVCGS
jgi:hypothetical protein